MEKKIQQESDSKWSSVTGLCLGIASVILWEFSIIPILAIIFGGIGLIRDKKRWMAGVGLALGIIFLLVRISQGPIVGVFSNTYSSSNNTQQVSTVSKQQALEYDNWKIYSPEGEQFKVMFPADFTIDTDSDPTDSAYTYKSYSSQTLFLQPRYSVMRYIGYSIKEFNTDSILSYHLDRLIKVPDYKLVSKNFTYYSSYRALDFLIDTGGDYPMLKGRFILVGKTLYVIGADYLDKNYNDKDYQFFINSFEINKIAWYQKMWDWFMRK